MTDLGDYGKATAPRVDGLLQRARVLPQFAQRPRRFRQVSDVGTALPPPTRQAIKDADDRAAYGPGLVDDMGRIPATWRDAFPRGTFQRLTALQMLEEVRDALYVRAPPLLVPERGLVEGFRRAVALAMAVDEDGHPVIHGVEDSAVDLEVKGSLYLVAHEQGYCPATFEQVRTWTRQLLAEAREEAGLSDVVVKRDKMQDARILHSVKPLTPLSERMEETDGPAWWVRWPMSIGSVVGKWGLNMMGLQSTWTELSDGVMHAFDSHPVSKTTVPRRPIVIVHGMFTQSQSMGLVAIALAGLGHRVIVPDLIQFDHGYSRGHKGAFLPFVKHADTVIEFVEKVIEEGRGRFSQVDMMGHSFGGWIAQTVAARTDMVRRAVLLAPAGTGKYRFFNSSKGFYAGTRATADIFSLNMPRPMAAIVAMAMANVVLSHQNLAHAQSFDLRRYYRRSGPVKAEVLYLQGTNDDLHQCWGNPGAHKAVSRSFAVAHPTPHVMEDLHNAQGYWLQDAGHALNMDSIRPVVRMAHALYDGGLAVLKDGAAKGDPTVESYWNKRDVSDAPLILKQASKLLYSLFSWTEHSPIEITPWDPKADDGKTPIVSKTAKAHMRSRL